MGLGKSGWHKVRSRVQDGLCLPIYTLLITNVDTKMMIM